MTAAAMPLTMATEGRPLTVVRVDAGAGLARKLADLGVTPGVRLRRLDAPRGLPVSELLHRPDFAGFLGGWGRGRHGRLHGGDRASRTVEGQNGAGDRSARASGWRRGKGFGPFRRRHHENHAGAVVVELKGSKYVLGYGVGDKIMVLETPEETEPRPGQ